MESRTPVVDDVIARIKAMISSEGYEPGSRLPTERELASRLSVSRNTIREAVRALSLTGVVESRRGSGTYVTSLAPKAMLDSMSLLVEFSGQAGLADILAVRRVLEAEAAARAAARISESELADLRSCLEQMRHDPQRGDGSVTEVTQADLRFHAVIAASSGNPVLSALINALGDRTLHGRVWRGYMDAGVYNRAQDEHEAIYDALSDGDPTRAAAAAAAHVAQVERFLRSEAAQTDTNTDTHLAGPIA
ncbi:FadR/GntR family transcriptional regulator [Streptomyces sp. NPDC002666]